MGFKATLNFRKARKTEGSIELHVLSYDPSYTTKTKKNITD